MTHLVVSGARRAPAVTPGKDRARGPGVRVAAVSLALQVERPAGTGLPLRVPKAGVFAGLS